MKIKYKNIGMDEIDDIDLELEETNELENIVTFDGDNYEAASDQMLANIRALPTGEEKSRAIRDLKDIQEISCNRQKVKNEKRKAKNEEKKIMTEAAQARKELELKNKTLEREMKLKTIQMEKEMEIREEEVKIQKRNGVLGFVGRILEVGVMFFGYNYLLNKQNEFEKEDNYSTSGSRGVTNNISRSFGGFGIKH